jgi:hypothetical protein
MESAAVPDDAAAEFEPDENADVRDRGQEELDWCLDFFGQLKPFIADTASRQCGMRIFMG